jgi:DNA-binding transcriptional MerR regulator
MFSQMELLPATEPGSPAAEVAELGENAVTAPVSLSPAAPALEEPPAPEVLPAAELAPRPQPMPEPPPIPAPEPSPSPLPEPIPEPVPLPEPEPAPRPTASAEPMPTTEAALDEPVPAVRAIAAAEPIPTTSRTASTTRPARRSAPATSAEKPKSKRGRKSLKEVAAEADLINIPEDEVLFSKQYYTMGEVAEMFRVNQSLLRFWETEFSILQPKKNKKGDRYFRPIDIKNLHLIYHLLRQRKYTIEGAKEFLRKNKKADERFEAIQRLQQIKAFLLELKAQL